MSTASLPAPYGCLSRRATAGEEIEHPVAGIGVNPDDTVQDGYRFLRWVSGAFLPVRADNRVPPGIGWGFSPCRLLGADETGGHIGDAVNIVESVGVLVRVFGIPEDVVMFRRPAPFGPPAVIISPDDFVEEGCPAENPVQQDFAVMHFPAVNMQEEGAGRSQQPVGFPQSRFQEGQVIVKLVAERQTSDPDRLVALSLIARAVTLPRSGLCGPGSGTASGLC